jgi:asparagine synthase (glutamine-hydrolysing)
MVDTLRHRGPNDQGIQEFSGAILGVTRLAIIDTSPAGHQPMSNLDGSIWIIYNGEVYNFAEEREQLERQSYVFKSRTDTEVILAMYQTYGDDFVKRLRGMFAIAIYDQRPGRGQERLLLIRDQLGIKPLLYNISEFGIVFASELKTILASGLVNKVIDQTALSQLLAYGSIPQPLTMIEGVRMLSPGHRLIWEDGRGRIEQYWQLDISRSSQLRQLPYSELTRLVRDKLEQVVKEQLVSDVPLGAFLSGGVDSTALVALMQKTTAGKLKTFSVGFGAEGEGMDETNAAGQIAQYLGTDHTCVNVTGEEVATLLPHIIRALDQPSVDGVNAYFVSRAASSRVTVAISGLGGDELFAGYPWFINVNNYSRAVRWWPSRVWYRLIATVTNWPIFDRLPIGRWSRVISKLRGLSNIQQKFAREYQVFGPEGARQILNPQLRSNTTHPSSVVGEAKTGSVLQWVSALALRGYTQNQLLRDTDTVSMSHSLEVRVPYLDPELVNLAISLPDIAKLNVERSWSPKSSYVATGAKRILIDAMRDLLPPNIDQQSKSGFGLPFANWLTGPLRTVMKDTLSPTTVSQRGLFRPAVINQIRKDFLAGRAHWSMVWLPMVTELWCREFID